MLISGLVKSSLIDYPSKIAAVVFFTGCNFRCPYCHNPDVVYGLNEGIKEKEILNFLKSRKGKLDGVVLSGGEPTLNKKLPEFIKKIKEMGFKVKLDTNGSMPDVVNSLISNELLDYIAMDIKGPLERHKEITNSNMNPENIMKTMQILKKSNVEFEYRTTVVKGMLDYNDFLKIKNMLKLLGFNKKYYLQRFCATKTLDNAFAKRSACSDIEMARVVSLFDDMECECFIR